MRAGICSIQLQALTPEAETTVKQAISLAKRRGHAQVTPLHVASAMLATSTGLLRRACLQCHSHPLQCKALELCFNVALNRLPASTPSHLLGPHYSTPSLSNALVAAFKRAQAHQRRGSIENQQQAILALKIEIEQLLISILDDPSVSRVMREAGFSSTQVKNRVEQTVPLDICSQRSPVSSQSKESTKPQLLSTNVASSSRFSQFGGSLIKPLDNIRNDDITSVLNEFLNKRKNTVIVGECQASTERVAMGMMERFEKGNVPGDLKYLQFVSVPLISLRNLCKQEVDQRFVELGCLVRSYVGRGIILYLGDLKWLFEYWSSYCEERRNYYSAVEHMVMQLKKLVFGTGVTGRLWLMGIANFQTYMRCKSCHPSLETIWELHPLAIPVVSLSLSLNLDSDLQGQDRGKVSKEGSAWPLLGDQAVVRKHLSCCTDCSVNFEKEAQSLTTCVRKKDSTTTSNLPSWLQPYKEESRSYRMDDQECTNIKDLCKKWNSFCSSVHRNPSFPETKPLMFSPSSPSSSNSVSSHDLKFNLHRNHLSWPLISEPKDCKVWISEASDEGCESNLIMFMPDRNAPKPDLLSNPNSSPNSASSSEAMDGLESRQMFNELNAENLKILCDALKKSVPWQKDIITEISSTILLSRSGMAKPENKLIKREHQKEETWMLFLGVDYQAKEKISRELAKVVFGSHSNFVSISLSSSSSTGADLNEGTKIKRKRDEMCCSYLQRFGEAVNENPHRVFFMEDIEHADYFSQKGIKQTIGSGRITLADGETVPLMDAIIIFSCERFSSTSRACSPSSRQKSDENEEEDKEDKLDEKNPCLSLDLNIAVKDDAGDELSVGKIGILESVDRKIIFKTQELC
ncbi:Protein SMAX1-LIKE 3 [Quillaja saponaria]|uniref:Protein SMAX1-LIKE 3 n=1 Tax=Quillaja saponaria TaxID=32244 RepID=A0AAD7PWZ3_QUISA|nr:Protein SMAX1-LIKE 3 [Quillaja saponaria]